MKKYIISLLILTSISLVGCGNKNSANPNTKGDPAANTNKTEPSTQNSPTNTTTVDSTKSTNDTYKDYVGNWYTSSDYTGGNSTTIEIKEISDKTVSFHLYFCRTYSYEGTNIKLENNTARFVDNTDGYTVSGTIEFGNKSITVNIEKTNNPLLKAEKTIFNFKASKFSAISTTPRNEDTDVDLDKGIEIDFGRKITPTVNPTVLLTKVGASKDSINGFIEMTIDIKDTKLIFMPDYEAMKSVKQVIEPGQKYELIIGEGAYKDNAGNINSEIVLDLTTKK